MTAVGKPELKVKVDKTLAASVALHVLVIGWGLVSFSTRALEVDAGRIVPVDVISADQLAKVMAGMKTGKKENPKPLVEKVAEAKPPIEDAVGKIDDKKPPVVTETAPSRRRRSRSREAGREEARSAEAGRREQAEGRAEAGREEARAGEGRPDRRSAEERSSQEAAAEAGRPRPPPPEPQKPKERTSISRRSRRCSTSAIRPASGRPARRSIPTPRSALRKGKRRRQSPRPGARCSSRRSNAAGRSPMAASRRRD